MTGRRVKTIDAVVEPGDYYVAFAEDGGIKALWFALPNGSAMWNRIAAEGYGHNDEPEWKIRVEDDGSVTVEPSIHYLNYWHGYLTRGEWVDA